MVAALRRRARYLAARRCGASGWRTDQDTRNDTNTKVPGNHRKHNLLIAIIAKSDKSILRYNGAAKIEKQICKCGATARND